MSRLSNLLRSAADWTEGNPVLGLGQTGVELNTGKSKTGNGRSTWTQLRYNNTDPMSAPQTLGAIGATETLVYSDVVNADLDANTTLTFPEAIAGHRFVLALKQASGGSHTVTWDAAVKWSGGTAPTLTTTNAKRDVFEFFCTDGATWFGRTVGLNYA